MVQWVYILSVIDETGVIFLQCKADCSLSKSWTNSSNDQWQLWDWRPNVASQTRSLMSAMSVYQLVGVIAEVF